MYYISSTSGYPAAYHSGHCSVQVRAWISSIVSHIPREEHGKFLLFLPQHPCTEKPQRWMVCKHTPKKNTNPFSKFSFTIRLRKQIDYCFIEFQQMGSFQGKIFLSKNPKQLSESRVPYIMLLKTNFWRHSLTAASRLAGSPAKRILPPLQHSWTDHPRDTLHTCSRGCFAIA